MTNINLGENIYSSKPSDSGELHALQGRSGSQLDFNYFIRLIHGFANSVPGIITASMTQLFSKGNE
jgi:hypothetical protein